MLQKWIYNITNDVKKTDGKYFYRKRISFKNSLFLFLSLSIVLFFIFLIKTKPKYIQEEPIKFNVNLKGMFHCFKKLKRKKIVHISSSQTILEVEVDISFIDSSLNDYNMDKLNSFSTQNIITKFTINEFEVYWNKSLNPKCPALNKSEWKMYKELTTPNFFVKNEERFNLTIKDVGFVTFVSKNHMKEAFANCKSILLHDELKKVPFTVFLSDDMNEEIMEKYQEVCPQAKLIKFPFDKFPKGIRIMEHYRFKAIHEAMAFKNHKILLSFDSSVVFMKELNFTALIESSVKNNPTDVTLLTSSNHNMFVVTFPKTYDCFPKIFPKNNTEIMIKVPEYQGGLILWIGTENGWKAMRRFVECSLQPTCIAPPGATKKCNIKKIYTNQKTFSGCHRFDQTVINLILYENSNFNYTWYQRKTSVFTVVRLKS